MKIEKLTENKIRIILKKEDFKNKSIDIKKIFSASQESQGLFLEILDKAKKEVDFDTDGHKLLIEAFFEDNDAIVFIITKYLEKKPKKYVMAKKSSRISNNSTYIYQIDDFEDFCAFCTFIDKKFKLKNLFRTSILYFYQDVYYLVINEPNLSNFLFDKLHSILLEFFNILDYTDNFEFKLKEHGKLIIKNNAINTGIKYFAYNKSTI